MSTVVEGLRERMDKTVHSTSRDMSGIRTGKASPALLDSIKVECWGDVLPLKQVAGISAPEARMLVIQPWDVSTSPAIVKAIESSDLGIRASIDGPVIRIPIPKLSEERRKDLLKLVRKLAEDGRTAVRNLRREVNDLMHRARKEGDVSEDEEKRSLEEIQKIADKAISEIDRLLKAKETEILEV
jgi:ribosome recycling factor